MRILFLSITLILAAEVFADVYRSVDEHGNITFTDKYAPNTEKIKIKNTTTIDSSGIVDFPSTYYPLIDGYGEGEYSEKNEKKQERIYKKIKITNPKNDHVFTNTGSVTVSVVVRPSLKTANGDYLVLTIDGNKIATSSLPSFNLTDTARGVHTITVYVANQDGEPLIHSAPISFIVKRQTIL